MLHSPSTTLYRYNGSAGSCLLFKGGKEGWGWENGRFEGMELVGFGNDQENTERLLGSRRLGFEEGKGGRGMCNFG